MARIVLASFAAALLLSSFIEVIQPSAPPQLAAAACAGMPACPTTGTTAPAALPVGTTAAPIPAGVLPVAAPTASVPAAQGVGVLSCPKLLRDLKSGSRDSTTGGEVTQLQRFLAGYYKLNAQDSVSGYFGATTKANVQKFQGEKGLSKVGTVGPATRAAIAASCPSASAFSSQPITQTSPSTTVPVAQPSAKTPPYTGPMVELSAVPQKLGTTDTTRISWSATRADRCYFLVGTSTPPDYTHVSGSKLFSPKVATEYGVRCEQDVGNGATSTEKKVTVEIVKPACSIKSDKSAYKFGEPVKYSWTSENTNTANFLLDPAKPDFVTLPRGEVPVNGSLFITANTRGSYSVSLVATNLYASTTCSTAISVS